MSEPETRDDPDRIEWDEPIGDTQGRPPLETASDVLRRFFYTGVGALFATEEGLRKLAGELPKEAASFVVNQAQHTKDEVLRVLATELRRFLENVDMSELIRRALSHLTLEVKTQIRFLPNDGDGKSDAKRKGGFRRKGDDEPK